VFSEFLSLLAGWTNVGGALLGVVFHWGLFIGVRLAVAPSRCSNRHILP